MRTRSVVAGLAYRPLAIDIRPIVPRTVPEDLADYPTPSRRHGRRPKAAGRLAARALVERLAWAKYPLVYYKDPDRPVPFIKAYAPQNNLPLLTKAATASG